MSRTPRSGFCEWLDFREGSISSLTINGQSAPTAIQNGHVELPAKLLKLGENVVEIDFNAPVAPAGKAITRFEDKDDGSEYIYTLFVPMDADMAFPCFDQPDLKAKFQSDGHRAGRLDGYIQQCAIVVPEPHTNVKSRIARV